jgi:hypothetical protein
VRYAADIRGVFLRGRYLDRPALDAVMEGVAAAQVVIEAAETVSLELPGEEVFRGRYRSTFQGSDGGVEEFLITRDDDGYHLMARGQLAGGPMQPFVLTYHAGQDFTFRGATWRLLVGDELDATYTPSDGVITASARHGDTALPVQTLPLEQNMLMTGPATAMDFASLGAAGLSVGQTRSFKAVGFGFGTWKMTVTDYTLTRHEDTRYTYILDTDWGEFTGEIWTNEIGIVLKSILKMPAGTITIVLE